LATKGLDYEGVRQQGEHFEALLSCQQLYEQAAAQGYGDSAESLDQRCAQALAEAVHALIRCVPIEHVRLQ
jgi:hypothetical protein